MECPCGNPMKKVHAIGDTLFVEWCRACGTLGYCVNPGPKEKKTFQRPVIAQALRIDKDWEQKEDK